MSNQTSKDNDMSPTLTRDRRAIISLTLLGLLLVFAGEMRDWLGVFSVLPVGGAHAFEVLGLMLLGGAFYYARIK